MLKLSIIIPVYNVEEYVEKCLISCAKQNLDSSVYEIIVVNDGTTDRSLEIVERVIKDYDNIYVVSQSNAGLSAARNKGLSLAKGEYVWFVDSDDWIDSNCLNEIVSQLVDIDILAMGYRSVEKERSLEVNVSNQRAKDGRQLLNSYTILAAPFYIYKRSFLDKNNLSFMQGIFHEDFEFIPRMLYFAENVEIYPLIVYNYYRREGSITKSVNYRKSLDLLFIANKYHDFLEKNVEQQFKTQFYDLISLALNNSLANSLLLSIEEKRVIAEKFYESRLLFSAMQNSSRLKYRIEGTLFSLFPRHCFQLYFLLVKLKR